MAQDPADNVENVIQFPGEEVVKVTSLDRIGVIAQHTARVYQTLLLIVGEPQVALTLTEITLRTIGPLAFNPGVNFEN